MNLLGVTMGVTASAAAMKDGEIVACASEERFIRKKNYDGYPRQAVEFCAESLGRIDKVLLASHNAEPAYIVTHQESDRSVVDWVREQRDYWYPRFYGGRQVDYVDVFRDKLDYEQFPGPEAWSRIDVRSPQRIELFREERRRFIAAHLGLPLDAIEVVEHHLAHSMYGFYASPFRGRPVLCFTADGFGDHSNATLRAFSSGGSIELLMETDRMNLGRLYRYITLLLGMKPGEHEYKVMGLAPYATEYHWRAPYDVFKETLYVDGLDFSYKTRPTDHYFYFKEELEGDRFDGIAGGLQRYAEDLLVPWVKNGIAASGIRTVVFSGGVAMNIKAMMELTGLPELEELWVPPSGSDESLAMGACYAYAHRHLPAEEIRPLPHVYLGPHYGDAEIEDLVARHRLEAGYRVVRNASPSQVARHLADGHVVAAFLGRMEFGARALGARSILADPRDTRVIKRINTMVKNRDFWMPFAPVILKERAHEYLVNPKGIDAPFMTIGFETTALAQREIPAALHPADMTARPQIVERACNPRYYDIVKAFEAVTGVGALLNTSFNLHGYPIVMSPEDALHVFEHSGLDMLLLGETLIIKQAAPTA